jgi:hypothetical protein
MVPDSVPSIAARSMKTAAQSQEGKRNRTNTFGCERQNASKTPDPFDLSSEGGSRGSELESRLGELCDKIEKQ